MNLKKILLVEDDLNFGSVLKAYLELFEYEVSWIEHGKNVLKEFNENDFDLCILDIMLPFQDGFSIAQGIRNIDQSVPLIFVTAKTLKEDILKGFEIGADDYITKPFDSEILLCKIRAIMERSGKKTEGNNQELFQIGKFKFNVRSREIISENGSNKLSPKESELLKLLYLKKNDILSREITLKALWGDNNYFTTRSMDVFISKLRKYFADDPSVKILNVHGEGFRLVC